MQFIISTCTWLSISHLHLHTHASLKYTNKLFVCAQIHKDLIDIAKFKKGYIIYVINNKVNIASSVNVELLLHISSINSA